MLKIVNWVFLDGERESLGNSGSLTEVNIILTQENFILIHKSQTR